MTTSHQLHWSHGDATIVTTAAMLTDCVFKLDGRPFAPFARAAWVGTVDDPAIVGHLRVLAGDFVGIPFGMSRPAPGAPPEWAALMARPAINTTIHGAAADLDWTILSGDDASVTLGLDYPDNSPVERLERTITGGPGSPAIEFTLKIFAREATDISVGLHPNFRLPENPGRLQLDADFAFGLKHPLMVSDGQQEFAQLSEVRHAGRSVDMGHIPLSPRTDANVQLCGMRGPLRATWLDEGAAIVLDWDRALLPSLQIWHTDGGIQQPPWNGTFRAVGLEPMASAFDLHTDVSSNPNPINARGVATSIAIDPASPVTLRHSVTAMTA